MSSENAPWHELALLSSSADAPKFRLVGCTEGRAILGTGAAAVVEAGGRNVGMAELFQFFIFVIHFQLYVRR